MARSIAFSHAGCSYMVVPEQKARTTYDNLLRLIDDPDVREPLKFLRAREIVHFQRFGDALAVVQGGAPRRKTRYCRARPERRRKVNPIRSPRRNPRYGEFSVQRQARLPPYAIAQMTTRAEKTAKRCFIRLPICARRTLGVYCTCTTYFFAAKEEDEPMPTDYRTVRLMKNRLYPTYQLHAVMAARKTTPENGLKINLGDGEVEREFRITPKETGKLTLTAAVKQDKNELARDEKDFVVSEMPILTLKDGVITSVTVPGKDGADPEDITEIVKKNANEDGSFHVPEGATVSVAFDKDAFADSGLKFGHWDITGLDDPNAYQNKESFAFVMPAKGVTLKAMTQDASIEDDEPDIVGPIVIGTTVVVGGAVLGYQAYSLGAEFAGKLMALPYFPSNRSALAMMLWEDAGKPMPESELLYPDVGQEEQDMDLQHAARWAMENELIPDLNDEGTAPEEMKFYPDNTVSKIDVLNAWQKAQELKQNA